MIKSNKIQSKNDLGKYNIICTNIGEVKKCLKMLSDLGFKTCNSDLINKKSRVVRNLIFNRGNFIATKCDVNDSYGNINFYQFKKIYKKFKKEEAYDFEADVDGRIIKINNYDSEKEIYYYTPEKLDLVNHAAINEFKLQGLDNCLEHGLLFASEQSLLNHLFKMKIRTKIKNIAFELNNKKKLKENNRIQFVYYIKCDYNLKDVYQSSTAICNDINEQEKTIYCSSYNFLDEVKKEISKEDLIKYFELK